MSLKDLQPDNHISYIQGGRKLGVYNGDIASGTYIDINGNFINADGFALDENGYIMFDKEGKPIMGSTPSYIPIDEYQEDYNPWLSEYEKRKKSLTTLRRINSPTSTSDSLLLTCYFDIFNIKLDVPDELILGPQAFYKCWKHHMFTCKTVQVSWGDVFRTSDM